MRLLLVASDSMEFRGLLPHTAATRKISIGADWARTAKLNGHDVLLVANGVGRHRAAAAVDSAWTIFAADRVVSIGFGGALDPALRLSDIVIATCIAGNGRRFSALPVTGTI